MRYDEAEGLGVVTLIVFIAMIIVATVAAVVLFIPDSTMQQQVEENSDIIWDPCPTGFKVINVVGDRDNPNDSAGPTNRIEIIEIKIRLLAGSPAMGVTDTIIEITDGTVDANLTYVDTYSGEFNQTASTTQFTMQLLRDVAPTNDSTTSPLLTSGDVGLIFIDANAIGLNLTAQTTCEIIITPKYGIRSLESFTTPSVYDNRYVEL